MAPAKGDLRRAELLRAAAAVLVEQGFDAVTHRAVAARAGLPLAATTYYFASRDDLLEQAAGLAAQEWLAASRRRLQAGADDPARLVLEVVSAGRQGEALLALYARYLESARRPALRGVVAALDEQAAALVGEALASCGLAADADTARLVLATADGLLVGALARGADDPVAQAQAPLARLLGML